MTVKFINLHMQVRWGGGGGGGGGDKVTDRQTGRYKDRWMDRTDG